MISVVIPVLNESQTVQTVVQLALRHPKVSEVIVVDDGSIDGTPELASQAGARVLSSTFLGKGASMEDGMWAAHNDVILYLDGDLAGLDEDLIEQMITPLIENQADFVKAKFSRSAGHVTTLTARPLLRIFFPELASYEQPLGGIIASRRSFLRRFRFETDYGVDIGLFVDAALAGGRLLEVDLGRIEHDSQSLESLGDMASQVVRTLFDRATRYGRFNVSQVREVEEVERRTQAEVSVVLQKVGQARRLAFFDMDRVLVNGRYVVQLAERTNKTAELSEFLDHYELAAEERCQRIASLFAGVPQEVFRQTARDIPLTAGAADAVVRLRKAGFCVGIVTDSFAVASETVRRRVFADFSIAHLMKFRGGIATGRLMLSPAMSHPQGCQEHSSCKRNVMLHMMERMGIAPEQVLAVGDGENDICMLREAGISIAFHPMTPRVGEAARYTVTGSLTEVLPLVAEHNWGEAPAG
jgi:glucosyl-3-phosphoglycerate synthase